MKKIPISFLSVLMGALKCVSTNIRLFWCYRFSRKQLHRSTTTYTCKRNKIWLILLRWFIMLGSWTWKWLHEKWYQAQNTNFLFIPCWVNWLICWKIILKRFRKLRAVKETSVSGMPLLISEIYEFLGYMGNEIMR